MNAVSRLLRPRVDAPLLMAVLGLVVAGVVMVAASSAVLADQGWGDPAYFVKRQIVFAVVGAAALIVAAGIDSAWLERRSLWLVGAALFLLVVVLIPGIGHVAGGSRRWLMLGPVGLQAGEVIKLAIVVHLAATLARKQQTPGGAPLRTRQREAAGEAPAPSRPREARASPVASTLPHFIIPTLAMGLLLAEPDFGTAVLLAAITFLMLFVGGARLGPLIGLVGLALPLAAIVISTSDYRMRRVLAFLDPWAHRYDIGYQITESLMTVGSGGLFGLGLGESRQKLFFLPAAHTDFIFSVIGEELGFVGVAAVLGCFAFIGLRAWRAAVRAKTPFHALLIIGLASMIVLQAIFNVAVSLGLVPTKGITLPFVSYGGSSLIMSMFCAGLLLRACADAANAPVVAGARSRSSTGALTRTGEHKLVRTGEHAVARGGHE